MLYYLTQEYIRILMKDNQINDRKIYFSIEFLIP